MKKLYLFSLSFCLRGSALVMLAALAGMLLIGCSSESQPGANNSGIAAANDPQQVAPPREGDPTPNVVNTENPPLLAEGEEIPPEVLERKQSRLEALREKGGTASGPTSPANVKPLSRPAPDNSVYLISLTDVATETRQFRDHPVLDKVEKISDPKGSKTTAYLRTGRRINIPEGRIKNLAVASASDLLVAAGLPPMPTPTPAPNVQMPNREKEEIRRKKAEEQPVFPRRP